MADYKVRLRLEQPVATPLHSGTLFGHLCWAQWHKEGDGAMARWLESLVESPLLLSDGLPAGWLPRPLLRPLRRTAGAAGPPDLADLEHRQREKALRREEWIPLKLFLEVRDTLNESVLLDALGRSKNKCTRWLEHRTAHNTINRHTGTTPPAGGLYFVDEYWPAVDAGRDWDVYVRGDIGRELLEELFQRAGAFGYGRDASLGRGHFTAEVENAPPELFAHPGNRLMSLSHGTLTANMREARYKVHTHYGKVGPLLAVNQPPFKRPVTLLQPGATFAPADSGPFGELLGDVHPHLPFVRHHAWHLTLPYSEVD